ncbi:MAG: alanine racemase [Rhodobacteraceae bacterium]|nr:alanine racemase [Paracoccaceae bacterium]
MFENIETPALVLDPDRLLANTQKMQHRVEALGLTLRPHFKTSKSLDVADIASAGRRSTFTVSTLNEAEYLADAGFDDLLYAVGITPNKFARVAAIQARTGKNIILCVDSLEMAKAVAEALPETQVMIEVDCGEHRGGISGNAPEMVEIARVLGGQLKGVMSHAGHSYSTDQIEHIKEIADLEASAARDAADLLRGHGIKVDCVSIGSTPTVFYADDLAGITEVRAGIYMFWDLAQYGRGMCALEDIAMSVLTTVIGHNRGAGVLTVDAGALAMSKDIGAQAFLPDAGYGWLCDTKTMQPTGLRIDIVHQEHGTVKVGSEVDFAKYPIGSTLRVLPNHACLTAAGGYGQYHLTDGRIWPRVDGW